MDNINIHNNSFREIIGELQNKITTLEDNANNGLSPFIYPQKYATGAGTEGDPWAGACLEDSYTACPTGGTIYLRAGYYAMTSSVNVEKAINIIGEGIGRTFIVTADDFGFNVTANYISFKGFTIDGDAQTENANTSYCFAIANCDYITLEDMEVKNCGRIGINILNVNYSLLQNIYAHDCYSHGIHPGGSLAGKNKYNTYNNIYAWNNRRGGFDDYSSVVSGNNVYNNLNCWDNISHGIAMTKLSGIVLSNSSASGNGGNGIYLDDIEDSNINNCLVSDSGSAGILLQPGVKNVNFTNVIVKNNLDGIYLIDSKDITFTSCQSYDDREIPLQKYGIGLYNNITGISLLNCKLSPNKNGDIYNPNNAVIKKCPCNIV